MSHDEFKSYHAQGYRFFPDEQTRTEYLQVGEGTWRPKKDDNFYSVLKTNLDQLHRVDSYYEKERVFAEDGYFSFSMHYCFPSAEQRASFIAKRKGEELRKEITEDTSVKEKVHEFVENFKRDHWPKPQTITICISDEAIERTAKTLSYGLEGDEVVRSARTLKAAVALLHMEATLS